MDEWMKDKGWMEMYDRMDERVDRKIKKND